MLLTQHERLKLGWKSLIAGAILPNEVKDISTRWLLSGLQGSRRLCSPP